MSVCRGAFAASAEIEPLHFRTDRPFFGSVSVIGRIEDDVDAFIIFGRNIHRGIKQDNIVGASVLTDNNAVFIQIGQKDRVICFPSTAVVCNSKIKVVADDRIEGHALVDLNFAMENIFPFAGRRPTVKSFGRIEGRDIFNCRHVKRIPGGKLNGIYGRA